MEPRPRTRPGFTLIELLVVVVIIGVLAALLLPVLQGAIRTARNATQAAELQVLSASLEAFKAKYGEYPPSRVMLCEDGIWGVDDATMIPVPGGGSDITYGRLAQRSIEALRRYWPGVPTWTTAAPPAPPQRFGAATTWYDFNGNGVFDAPATPGRGVILEGHEALVFWLGGLPLNTGTTADPQLSLSGFARGQAVYPGTTRPAPAPFRNNLNNVATVPANRTYHGDREQPSYEFRADRLVDDDGDGFPEYLDTFGLGKPLAYFRADVDGYDPNDVNLPEPDPAGSVPEVTRAFRVAFPVPVVPALGNDARTAVSPGPNPYTIHPANMRSTSAWHKPNSFQLLSAGRDALFGAGGEYAPNAAGKLPPEPGPANVNSTDPDLRDAERDNICNFAPGPLD